jgi:short-subunit dehydrogenase
MTTALITGASAGIGAAFAEELAARQTNLVLVARREAKLQQLAQNLQEQYKIQVDVVVQDLTAPKAALAVFDAVTQKGLTVDLLINNAGFGEYGDFADLDGEHQVGMIQLNILALVDLTHQFLPGMRQRRSGGIINMSSTAAFQPMPYFSVYAASKAFVLSFSEALWAENRSYGVHVLAVCPGPTETNFFQEAEFPSSLADIAARNYTPTQVVVREALQALEKKQSTVIPGSIANQLIANLHRFLPRETLANLWKNILGRSSPRQ